MRSAASLDPRGRFISSIGHWTTRPRSANGSQPCAAAPKTRSTSPAPAPRPTGCPPLCAERPCRSKCRHRRFHLPQRCTEPGSHLAQVPDVTPDRGVCQPGRGSSEHEHGQHIGLELGEFLRIRRRALLAQAPHHRQANPNLLAFGLTGDQSDKVRTFTIPKLRHKTEKHVEEENPLTRRPDPHQGSAELTGCRTRQPHWTWRRPQIRRIGPGGQDTPRLDQLLARVGEQPRWQTQRAHCGQLVDLP